MRFGKALMKSNCWSATDKKQKPTPPKMNDVKAMNELGLLTDKISKFYRGFTGEKQEVFKTYYTELFSAMKD